MSAEYRVNKSIAEANKAQLDVLVERFMVLIDRYSNGLTQYYLEDSGDNKGIVDAIRDSLNRVYGDAFVLSSQVNANIVANNDRIQALDKHLDQLKEKVNAENKMLQEVQDTGLAAIPRKHDMRRYMQDDYFLAAYYTLAILGGSYYLYNYFHKKQ